MEEEEAKVPTLNQLGDDPHWRSLSVVDVRQAQDYRIEETRDCTPS